MPSEDRRSFLTVQLYLDDDPRRVGGRTRFYSKPHGREQWAAIAPSAGSVIIFDHRVWHDGEPVTAGIKHVLRTDAVYERVDDVALEEPNVIRRHRDYALRASACRDGSIASAGRDGTVRRDSAIYDLRDGSITTLTEGPDGGLWCGSRAGALHRIVDGRVTRVRDGIGAVLASATAGELVVFTTAREQILTPDAWVIDAHDGWDRGICAHRDGFASCGNDGRVILVDEGRARELAQLAAPLRTIASDGELLHVGDHGGWVHTLTRDGSTLRSRRTHAAAVTSLAIVDGDVVSAGEDGFVKRSDVVLAELRDFVASVAVSPRGLVVAGYDGAVRLLG